MEFAEQPGVDAFRHALPANQAVFADEHRRVRSQDIRAVGRATQGVRLINLDDDDKVTAATLVEPEAKNGCADRLARMTSLDA